MRSLYLIQNYATDFPQAIVLAKSSGDRSGLRGNFPSSTMPAKVNCLVCVDEAIKAEIRSIATVAECSQAVQLKHPGGKGSMLLNVFSSFRLNAAIATECALFLKRSNWAL